MAINERLIHTAADAAGGGTGNQEEGLILHLDANDVDSYDGDGSVWYDIKDHEYTPATNADEHFNTVLYTGNDGGSNNTTQAITGVGFGPDLVWIKNRDHTYLHYIFDSVRGDGKELHSNDTSAQIVSVYNDIRLDSDGFTTGTGDGTNKGLAGYNSYVAWCFKAGGAPSGSDKVSIDGTSYADEAAAGLTAGTIAVSGLSANTDLGFSVVKVVDHTNTKTISHGLGTPPELIITKVLDSSSYDWYVYHKDLGNTKYLNLNTASAAAIDNFWNYTSPTSQVFTHRFSSTAYDMIYYCFTSKRGVSKVGSYTGTGTAGNKVYTGFEPAFVMLKSSSTGSWIILDNKRNISDPRAKILQADLNTAEIDLKSTYNLDCMFFHKDGFSLQDSNSTRNASNTKYIYYAVAKNTKETSLIPDTDLELHLDAGDSTTTSSNWDDLSSNTYGETLTGVSFDEELGNWFTFTGGSEHRVSINDNGALTNVSNFTVELWANIKDNNGYRYLWSNIYTTNGQRQVYCYVDNSGRIEFTVYSGNGTNDYKIYLTSSVASTIHNKWVHYAFVLSNGLPSKIYLNGVDTPISAGGTGSGFGSAMHTSSTADFAIGSIQNPGDTANANGDIGQFRMYHTALTQDQIRQNYNFTKNNYPNGYNGTINGATWNAGGYFDFDGNDDYISPSLQTDSSELSHAFWYLADAPVSNTEFMLHFCNRGGRVDVAVGTATNDTPTASNEYIYINASTGTTSWTHVAIVLTGWASSYTSGSYGSAITAKVYINGDLEGTVSPTPYGQSTNLRIGRSGGGYYYDGKISDFKTFDKALTASEVTTEYNKGQFGAN